MYSRKNVSLTMRIWAFSPFDLFFPIPWPIMPLSATSIVHGGIFLMLQYCRMKNDTFNPIQMLNVVAISMYPLAYIPWIMFTLQSSFSSSTTLTNTRFNIKLLYLTNLMCSNDKIFSKIPNTKPCFKFFR